MGFLGSNSVAPHPSLKQSGDTQIASLDAPSFHRAFGWDLFQVQGNSKEAPITTSSTILGYLY